MTITTDSELMKELENDIEQNRLIVYYQPQFDAITCKIVSAEALVRRQADDGSLIPPSSFIPAAERTGFITKIDMYVLEQVCSFLRRSLDAGLNCVRISVNFSRLHLTNPTFADELDRITEKYGIPHELIEAELTESALISEDIDIPAFVNTIREHGYSVAIDDFGSGLSSLSLVKDINANVLKIDRSLLSSNCENEKERIVLESIFSFAHRLKLITVAEGVETSEQLGFLRTCNCSLIQGFLFSKPIPENDFAQLLSAETVKPHTDDILAIQSASGSIDLLLEAIFMKFPLVIMSNITRNSYYMMAYENFSRKTCPASGDFTDLIAHGASTMHPEDKDIFKNAFSPENLTAAYNRGEKFVRTVTRQMGDDGIYRPVETTDFFVNSPSTDDILVITLCQNLG